MSLIFLYLVGITDPGLEFGHPCEQALHLLLTQEKVAIMTSDVLERDTLVYTLGDGESKTAILGCRINRRMR